MTTLATQRHDTHGVSTRGNHGRWQDHAACRGMGDDDADTFFPEDTHQRRREAKAAREQELITVCLSCPVAQSCLDEAERLGERYGVRGGYTMAERGWKTR